MNSTTVNLTKNVTTIVNKDSFNTAISTTRINNIATTKINVTTIGIKGDSANYGIINRMDDAKGYKDPIVVDGELLSSHIYVDDTKAVKLYDITFTWTAGEMVKKVITEVASLDSITYDYVYTNGIPAVTIS